MSKKQKEWSRLDNAGKIFPSSTTKRDTKVFRFSCELFEDVNPDILQEALDETISQFPFFKSILRSGLFWYYLEQSNFIPLVKEEYKPPCSALFDVNSKNLLFEVNYYYKRINFEIYHAITDGTGALQFFKSLVCSYITKLHPELASDKNMYNQVKSSSSQKKEDSFQKYYTPTKEKPAKDTKSYKLRGGFLPEARLGIIVGSMSVRSILALAKKHNTTLSIYLCAVLLLAIEEDMRERDKGKSVVLSVPVNLRNYFSSETVRNFFATANISYNFKSQSCELDEIIKSVKESFDRQITHENMKTRITAFTSIEQNPFIRIVPLFIKNPVMRLAHHKSQTYSTCAFSNIGVIKLPQNIRQYINRFDVFSSTSKLQVCLCSFDDNLSISFTSPIISTEVQKNFFRILSSQEIEVQIFANQVTDEN